MAEKADPHSLEDPVVQIVATVTTRELDVGGEPRQLRRQGGELEVEPGCPLQPVDEIEAGQAPGSPGSSTAGQEYFPAGQVEVLGDLAACLAAADHDTGPGGRASGVA